MPRSIDYHFITVWRVPGTCAEVADVLADARGLVRWWPSVYLDVQELAPGNPDGVGRRIALFTEGWLPYTLRWQFTVTESDAPRGFSLSASGDFVGRGIWRFAQQGAEVVVTYDWRIEVTKPLLRSLSFVFKPIFSANHRWAMRMGEISLKLELERRRARTAEERARIPEPPGPTFAAWLTRRSTASLRVADSGG